MPFWRQESQAEKQERERQAADQKALSMGKIPLSAQHRLQAQVGTSKRFFTSDLTCNEHFLTRQAGYEPIGLVMGTAFWRVNFFSLFSGYQSFTGELTASTQAQLQAREQAISRMQQEASILGATGVVGVRLKIDGYDSNSRTVEFTAVGTAIKVKDHPPGELPFTSDLSGQEFWQLHQAGYLPKGVVFGVCSYYVHTNNQTRSVMNNTWWSGGRVNQELTQYTEGFQIARHLAMKRLSEDVQRHRADGCVGMKISTSIEDIEYEINDTKYHDLLAHFIAIGTAISQINQQQENSTTSPLIIYNLATGKSTQL